jgi:hypothetical protein
MGSTLANVVVHVNEDLDEDTVRRIEIDMGRHDGVISVGHRPGQPHLWMVVYDSGVTHAVGLLHPIRAHGLHAQLIGF